MFLMVQATNIRDIKLDEATTIQASHHTRFEKPSNDTVSPVGRLSVLHGVGYESRTSFVISCQTRGQQPQQMDHRKVAGTHIFERHKLDSADNLLFR